jgi:hypothetical protein
VATLVHDGDTVAIDAGTYPSDVARWTVSNLVLRGVGGMARLKANGRIDPGSHEYRGTSGVDAGMVKAPGMEVHPNPFHTSATIDITGAAEGSWLLICNTLGEEVRRISVAGNAKFVISKEGLPVGIYYARLVQAGKPVAAMRVVAVD